MSVSCTAAATVANPDFDPSCCWSSSLVCSDVIREELSDEFTAGMGGGGGHTHYNVMASCKSNECGTCTHERQHLRYMQSYGTHVHV